VTAFVGQGGGGAKQGCPRRPHIINQPNIWTFHIARYEILGDVYLPLRVG
jgi:hypothetical protein